MLINQSLENVILIVIIIICGVYLISVNSVFSLNHFIGIFLTFVGLFISLYYLNKQYPKEKKKHFLEVIKMFKEGEDQDLYINLMEKWYNQSFQSYFIIVLYSVASLITIFINWESVSRALIYLPILFFLILFVLVLPYIVWIVLVKIRNSDLEKILKFLEERNKKKSYKD